MSNNALKISNFLKNNKKITELHYPGLETDPGHPVAAIQMNNGFGGVLAFDVGANQEDAKRFISELEVIRHAVSLGATESLICIPYLTTLLYMPAERRTAFGVRPNTVRLSAGIEKTEILLQDLEQALGKLAIQSKPTTKIDAAQKPSKKKGTDYANIRI